MPTVADLKVVFSGDSSGAEAAANRTQGAIGGMTKGAIAGALAAGAAVGGFLAGSVMAAANFEQSIDGVSASLGGVGTQGGITEAQFAALSDEALRIGQTTSVGANDAARAMDLLAKSGISVEEIYSGVAQGVVNVSEATGESIEQSASSFGTLQNMFRDTGISSSQMSDTIVNAMNASDMSLSELQTGVARLAPVISATGMSFQDSAGAIAYFNSLGFSAAEVGTSLTAAFTSMVAPTTTQAAAMEAMGIAAFDAQGAFVGFPAIMDQVAAATAGMTEEQTAETIATLFGADARDLMTEATKEGGGPLRDYIRLMNQSGTAATASATRMDNLKGDIDQLRGSIETLMIRVGTAMLPGLRSITQTLTGVIESIMDFGTAIADLMDGGFNPLQAVLEVIRTALVDAGFDTAAEVVRELVTAAGALGDAFSALMDGDISGFFAGLVEAASSALSALGDLASLAGSALLDALSAAFTSIPWGTLWDTAVAGLRAVVGGAIDLGEIVLDGVAKLGTILQAVADDVWGWLQTELGIGGPSKVDGEPLSIGDVLIDGVAKLGTVLQGVADNVRGWLEQQGIGGPTKVGAEPISLGTILIDGILELGGRLKGFAANIGAWIRTKLGTISNLLVQVGSFLIDGALDLGGRLLGFARNVGAWIRTKIGTIQDALVNVGSLLIDAAVAIGGALKGFATNVAGWVRSNIPFAGTIEAVVGNLVVKVASITADIDRADVQSEIDEVVLGWGAFETEAERLSIFFPFIDVGRLADAVQLSVENVLKGIFGPAIVISKLSIEFLGRPEVKLVPAAFLFVVNEALNAIFSTAVKIVNWTVDFDMPELNLPGLAEIVAEITALLPHVNVNDIDWTAGFALPEFDLPPDADIIDGVKAVFDGITVGTIEWIADMGTPEIETPSLDDIVAAVLAQIVSLGTIRVPVKVSLIPDWSFSSDGGGGGGVQTLGFPGAPVMGDGVAAGGGGGMPRLVIPPPDTSQFIAGLQAMTSAANQARQAVHAAFVNMQIDIAAAVRGAVTSAVAAFTPIQAALTSAANTARQSVHAAFVNMQIQVAATMTEITAAATAQGLAAGQGYNTAITQGLTAAAANVLIQMAAMRTSMITMTADARAQGLATGQGYNSAVTQGMNAAVANTQIAMGRIRSALNIGSQHSVGFGIGSSLGAGINAGIASWTSAIAATAVAAVFNAAAQARTAAESTSPSKLFMRIGSDMGEGMVRGIEAKHRDAANAFAGLIPSTIASPDNGAALRARQHASLAYAGRNGAGGGGNTYIINVLKSDELIQVLKGSEQGRVAYAQMSSRGRELALGLRGA